MKKSEKARLTGVKANVKADRLAALIGSGKTSKADNHADWARVDGTTLGSFVALLAANGGAILLGTSRDGTQYHVKIYVSNNQENFWFAGNDDGLQDLYDWIGALSDALLD